MDGARLSVDVSGEDSLVVTAGLTIRHVDGSKDGRWPNHLRMLRFDEGERDVVMQLL